VTIYPFLRGVSSFAGRLLALTFLLSLLLAFLWVAGNAQGFLDTTQAALLAGLRGTLLVELAAGVWTAGILVVRTVVEHRWFPVRFVLALLCLAGGGTLLALLGLLQAWLRP
jgi:hypothetical protein